MNASERFQKIMHFEKPDRVFLWAMPIREGTRMRWYGQGLPENIDPHTFLELDVFNYVRISDDSPFPHFQKKIYEETKDYTVYRDGNGIKQKWFKHRKEPGFDTRQYLDFPVKTRGDFLKIKKRYSRDSIVERFPADWSEKLIRWQNRDYVLGLDIKGFFYRIRQWMGFENTCLAFIESPDFVQEMVEFITDFITNLTEKILEGLELKGITIDFANIGEDIAYKGASMISPDAVRKFLFPGYRKITDLLRKYNIDVINLGSDGDITELVPVCLDAGINGHHPLEIAAGVDPVSLRKKYSEILMIGGIDKRELAKNKRAIEKEVFSKVPYLLKKGGYIPACDHAVPPDVPLENFQYYVSLLRGIGDR